MYAALCGHVGKSQMGKTSTANSLFNETVAEVTTYQRDHRPPQAIRRSAKGAEFDLTIIDTPGLVNGDEVNESVSTLDLCIFMRVGICKQYMWQHCFCVANGQIKCCVDCASMAFARA